MKIIIILLSIMMILFVIILLKIKLKVNFIKNDEKSYLSIRIWCLAGLIHYTYKLELKPKSDSLSFGYQSDSSTSPESKKERVNAKETGSYFRKAWLLIRNSANLFRIVLDFFQNIVITELQFVLRLGSGDAAKTATLIGKAWAAIGTGLGLLQCLVQLKVEPQIEIDPFFNERKEEIELTCIFHFRLGHLIWAGIKFIWSWHGEKRFFLIPVLNERKNM